ncbi:pentapeptide repeat-containing protein [Sulfurimonas sp.]|uniref:pentapeptide repeat-containing protein n=1 Tax=Sulfurimonas sp. TaxID=2022749 RepID=UPI00262F1A77|nr:pentapeptide repeat-containing protein [Sulfurimonas sp.]
MNNKISKKNNLLLKRSVKQYKLLKTSKAHDCSFKDCQFNAFLNLQKNVPNFIHNINNNDTYCLFHTPRELQNKLSLFDINNLQLLIEDYVTFCISHNIQVDFSGVVLHNFVFPTKNRKYKDVLFNKAYFIGYPDFDNLCCENLFLEDCIFERGARFKNIQIDNMIFKPKKLKEAVVFEAGGYISSSTGLIFDNKDSYIHNIKIFKNHVEGDGKVFFVGCNFQQANFTNGMLDQLVFQNCNLTNTRFLNSKVDETEFRNCKFPSNYERKYLNDIQGKEKYLVYIAPLLIISPYFIYPSQFTLWSLFFAILLVPLLWFLLYYIGAFTHIFFHYLNKALRKNIKTNASLNTLSTGDHICTQDEFLLYEQMSLLNESNKNFRDLKENIQLSLQSLSEVYQNLRKNFENSKEVQKAGDFFFSQRYMELISGKKNLIETSLLSFHYFVNGFGEKFIRPLIWLVITVFSVAFSTVPNIDYIATSNTPLFLLKDYNETIMDNNMNLPYVINSNNIHVKYKLNLQNNLKVPYIKGDSNTTFYTLTLKNKNKSNIGIYYSLAGVVSFVTPESKQWFKNRTEKASKLQLFEGILSWFFLGAFVLSIRNRIRRQ